MSSLNRRGIITTGFAAIFSFFGSAVFAAQSSQGPTLKPKRVGQILDWRNKRYTAIKSGKKIVWNKGVPAVKPVASETPEPVITNSPTPTPEATPASTPSPSGEVMKDVTAGAFCAPAGASGVTKTGLQVSCKTSATDTRNRWRQ
jgi:hypothetical protein